MPNTFGTAAFWLAIFICHSASSQSVLDPCGGSHPSFGFTRRSVIQEDLARAMRNITMSAAEAAVSAEQLKNRYIATPRSRISPALVRLQARSHVVNFPFTRRPFMSSEVTAALQSDYDDVSTIIMFMKYVHRYETENEYRLDMEAFQHKLYNALCKVKIAADANGQSLSYTITDDVVTRKVIRSDAFRYARDYIVFRDAEVFLSSVSAPYSD